jgi:hypothetical protein
MHSVGLLAWIYVNTQAGTNDRRHGIRLTGLYRAMCARDGQSPIGQFDVQLDPVETILGESYAKAWYGMIAMGVRQAVAEPWRDPDHPSSAGLP